MARSNNKSNYPTLRNIISDLWDQDKFFDNDFFKKDWTPRVNVKEKKDKFEVEVAAPGLQKGDFNISVENGVLTISGDKEQESKKEEENYTRREYNYGSFSRSFVLPESVTEEDINANYKDGILRIVLNKKEEAKEKGAKKISVS